MPNLDLSVDEVLSTTRAVRKRIDLERPVDLAVVKECLELALQAPTGSNAQGWQFMVVTDPGKRAALGDLYARAFERYRAQPNVATNLHADDPVLQPVQQRVMSSAEYLAEHMAEMPVLVLPCIKGRLEDLPVVRQAAIWGSILPAAWSFMLAARSRGLGTSYTTMHLNFEEEAADVLGIPFAEYTQAALIPVGWTVGTDFRPGARIPLDSVLHIDTW